MLRWRVALGTLFVALLVAACWLDARPGHMGRWLLPLAILLAGLAAQEVASLLAAGGRPRQGWGMIFWSVLIVAANGLCLLEGSPDAGLFGPGAVAGAAALVGVFACEIIAYGRGGPILDRLAYTAMGISYVSIPFTFLVQLRLLGSPLGQDGLAALGSLVAVVKSCDTGAYFTGRALGRHKLAPSLSPGKTIEGLLGGLALACLAAFLTLGLWLPPSSGPVPWAMCVVFGLVVGAVSVVGDLAESLLKRQVGRKDSSTWMPGFGGVLDVLDSLLLAAPAAYVFWRWGAFA